MDQSAALMDNTRSYLYFSFRRQPPPPTPHPNPIMLFPVQKLAAMLLFLPYLSGWYITWSLKYLV